MILRGHNMPELPEVETISRELRKAISGKKISQINVLTNKPWQANKEDIVGQKILTVRRRAKNLVIDLSNGYSLYFHLKMTGQLVYREKSVTSSPKEKGVWWAELPNKHTHVVFEFANGGVLYFNDLRKFGWIRSSKTSELLINQEKDFGIEPLSNDFTFEILSQIIKSHPKQNIKKILTDQTLIAGIGNIYADESLFYAGILPTRLGVSVKKQEISKLRESIIKSLTLGITHKGASDRDYIDAHGERGSMQKFFMVYKNEGQSCQIKTCTGKIQKIRLNGRGTHFCESCQK